MLNIKDLSKSFDNKEILKNINLDIEQGKIVSLLGLSGSGKSTLLNLIAGFEEADSGSITYKGVNIFDSSTFIQPEKRDIGFVFQNYALFPHIDVGKNICFGISDKPKPYQARVLYEMLELMDLEDKGSQYPHQLSGGQQQRVAIARVLAKKSELILFDEAFSSIDSTLKLKLILQIKKILKSHNKTAIFVTHCPREALMLSDKIAYIEKGEIIQFGTAKELNENPVSQSVSNLFGDNSFMFKTIDQFL